MWDDDSRALPLLPLDLLGAGRAERDAALDRGDAARSLGEGELGPGEDREPLEAAAAVALGRSSNGRLEWKSADGGTYGDWENRGVE